MYTECLLLGLGYRSKQNKKSITCNSYISVGRQATDKYGPLNMVRHMGRRCGGKAKVLDEVTSEQRLKENEEDRERGESLQAPGLKKCRRSGEECAGYFQGRKRRPVWLEQTERGEEW